jgi:radical SAM protein with 4Fe4S-binding SPASM domain
MDLMQVLFNVLPGRGAKPLTKAGIEPGLYCYLREQAGVPTRFHLRVDPRGSGLLVANASAAARLHASGVIIAKGLLENEGEPAIAERLHTAFRKVPSEQIAADVREVRRLIERLPAPGDDYPIVNFADPAFAPRIEHMDRPLSADVSLAGPERLEAILSRLWDLAIPHVTLIAGDEPDPAVLVRAVEKAEDLGLIAGVRGRGSVLAQGTLIRDLARAGVDHVNVLCLASQPGIHDSLAGPGDHEKAVEVLDEVRRSEVCSVAEIALVEKTYIVIDETLRWLSRLDIRNAAFYAAAMTAGKSPAGAMRGDDLIHVAATVEESAANANVRFLWYPPLRFRLGQSLAGLVLRGPRSSGDTAIRVQPDGSVIPARGPNQPAGNLLTDPWERIWASQRFRDYRRRIESDTRCDDCPGMAICAADCPRDPAGWADGGNSG